eukprot:6467857-Amphidinium_carterae.1
MLVVHSAQKRHSSDCSPIGIRHSTGMPCLNTAGMCCGCALNGDNATWQIQNVLLTHEEDAKATDARTELEH